MTLGKIIGGGLAVGAIGASQFIMEHLAPIGKVYQAGTLSANPLAMVVVPVRWEEPFGIAVIEVMSQGLPVIGSPYGSLPELISKEVGFIAKNHFELEALVSGDHSAKFNPDIIRKHVEDNFAIKKHAESYVELYKKVINGESLNTTPPTYKYSKRAEELLPF